MLLSNKTKDGVLISELGNGSEKIVMYECDCCGVKKETIYHNYTLSQKKRNNDGKTYCKKCATKKAAQKRKGIKTGPREEKYINHGENHPSWKGGDWINNDGYKMKYLGKRKYKAEHRYLIEQKIGRELNKTEIVHHINCDKLDNRIENLFLCKNEEEHRKLHNSEYEVFKYFFNLGLIKFENEEYSVAHLKLRELLEHLEVDNQQPSQ